MYDALHEKAKEFIKRAPISRNSREWEISHADYELVILKSNLYQDNYVFLIFNRPTREYFAFKLMMPSKSKVGAYVLSKSRNIDEFFEILSNKIFSTMSNKRDPLKQPESLSMEEINLFFKDKELPNKISGLARKLIVNARNRNNSN